MDAIQAKTLSKSYGPVVALHDVSFSVEKGEVIGLLGPNGAGKTTIMKILTGYLQADQGRAVVCGMDVAKDPIGVQSRIGYLPEHAPLYREMIVQEYLLMMCELRGVPKNKRRAWLSDAIDATGLDGYLTRYVGQLSKGYRQRVGLAQALLHKPEILILDEPTSGLDPTQIVEIRELIKELSKSATVMLSTHILPEVEMTCQRVIMILKGQLGIDDQIANLRAVNAAVVEIDKSAADVESLLGAVSGVDTVEEGEIDGDFKQWRVVSGGKEDLCPALFQALRKTDVRVGELRRDIRTLETVFRELAAKSQNEEVAA